MRLSFRSIRSLWLRLTRAKYVKLHGVRVGLGSNLPVCVRTQLYRNTYEYGERLLLNSAVLPGDRVLEFGAGMGVVGLLAAKLAGPNGTVLSVEANPTLESVIRENQRLNLPKIRPPLLMLAAVTADGRTIDFHCNDDILSSSLINRGKGSSLIRVQGCKAGDLVFNFRPTVLVMDVEGAEYEILLSIDFIGIRVVLVEIHSKLLGTKKVSQLLRHLNALGYELLQTKHSNYLFQRHSST